MCPAAGCAVAPAGRCGHLPPTKSQGVRATRDVGDAVPYGRYAAHSGMVKSSHRAKKKALAGFLFFYFMLSMAFSAKLLSTSASKSTHCAFVSSPASVITVSSRSSAERAIMGAAFHASICR